MRGPADRDSETGGGRSGLRRPGMGSSVFRWKSAKEVGYFALHEGKRGFGVLHWN